jgi:hypothetical protein
MSRGLSSGHDPSRWVRLLRPAAVVVLGALGLLLLPDLAGWFSSELVMLTPAWFRRWLPFALYVGVGLVLTARPKKLGTVTIPDRWWSLLDRASDRALGWPSTALMVTATVLMLSCWVPHYLTWPWWADADYLAVVAQSWDAGVLPYRDLDDFNFPGAPEMMWVLGKTFGWGKTAPLYVLDAALLGSLGLALGAWSRVRFGRALPGLSGYVIFLTYYLELDYSQVAQRDWHATLLAVFGLLAPAAWRGRPGRLASAVLYAAALTMRPHAILFAPAVLSAVDEGSREPGDPRTRLLPALAEWTAAFAVALTLTFAPLLLGGILDDFVRCLGHARPGGAYNHNTPLTIGRRLLDGVLDWRTSWTLAALAVIAAFGPARVRRPARTWLIAGLGVLLYKPLSPVQHRYLNHPLWLIVAVGVAPVVAALLESVRTVPALKLLTVALILDSGVDAVPGFCSPARSYRAVEALVKGRPLVERPLGLERSYSNLPGETGRYAWDDYRRLLEYLRRTTGPRTRVANVLRRHPLPAINGPVGRLSPFPTAQAMGWMYWFGPGIEAQCASALEQGTDIVVVWSPGDSDRPVMRNLKLETLTATIRRSYQPGARFGAFEVWFKAPAPRVAPCPRPVEH